MYTIQDVVKEADDRISFLETLLLDTVINDENEMGGIPYWLASPRVFKENETVGFSLAGCIGDGICGGGAPLFCNDGLHMSFKIGVRPIICLNSNTTVNDIQVISETKDKIDFSELDIEIDTEPEQLTGEEGMIEPVAKTITLVFNNAWSSTESGEIGTFEVEKGETIAEVIERIQNFNGYTIKASGGWIDITLPSGNRYRNCSLTWTDNDNWEGNVLDLPCILEGEYVIAVQPE